MKSKKGYIMKIKSFKVLIAGEWLDMEYVNKKWKYRDIIVVVDDDGNVIVSGEETELFALRVEFDGINLKDFIVLGDAWERAYANLEWIKPDINNKMPWYFIANNGKMSYGFGVKTQPNAFCSWQCSEDTAMLTIDVRSGTNPIKLKGRELSACSILITQIEGNLYEACNKFCLMLCDSVRKISRPIFGGNDWYCNYGDNSFNKILLHTKRVVECAKKCKYKPYMVIDDGWELCHHQSEDGNRYYNGGPWKYCNDNFGDMKKMAEAIEEAGAIPGIWFRPLWTVEKFPEEFILKTDGMKDTLDPSVPEVLDIIKKDVKRLREWGYKLIKHDFSTWDIFGKWGFEMEDGMHKDTCIFFDKTHTTAEIIKKFYLTIREAAGEDVLVMGCNTISHLSAGIFDIQRTGDDTSGLDWERTKNYGINTLAFRMPQHNAFYAVDADCVGITKNIPWEKNRQWLDVLAKSGTPLFVSIAENAYTDEVKNDIKEAFECSCMAKNVSKPLDWLESKIPSIWESDFGKDSYDW